jgi:peptidoglycan glycosyltransferase
MNKQIRKLTSIVIFVIIMLLCTTTYYQFVSAKSLKEDTRNTRTFCNNFNNARGPIVIDNEQVALSKPIKDDYKYIREYKNSALYSPITGFYSVVYGMSGLENYANEQLMGKSNSFLFSRINSLITGQQNNGGIVELTIDKNAQKVAYDSLGAQTGAVVALDPTNGEIKALVSKPSYDANLLASHNSKTVSNNYNSLISNKKNPMLNRATNELYAPGSTFKLITAATALETGKYDENSKLKSPKSYKLPESNSYLTNMYNATCSSSGYLTMKQALDVSCNTTFAILGQKLGADAISVQAEKFGYGNSISIPNFVVNSSFPVNIDKAQTAMSAIGQFDVKTTVLQNALVTSAIANNGIIMMPHLIKDVKDSNLHTVYTTNISQFKQAISSSTAQKLKNMMRSVVTSGTGSIVNLSGIYTGAKTGTAEKGDGLKPNNWFVSFAEKGDKHLVVAVLVEDGGYMGASGTGSGVAGPIAKSVINAYINK